MENAEIVRKIMDEFYKPTPDGLIGNEDCGQMSAWYILSASGFYPVAPGDADLRFRHAAVSGDEIPS